MDFISNAETKITTIQVNGQEHEVDKADITYEEIVNLGFGNYEDNANIVYTILYFKGNQHKPKGQLVKGEAVKVAQGMIFNVTRTDRS